MSRLRALLARLGAWWAGLWAKPAAPGPPELSPEEMLRRFEEAMLREALAIEEATVRCARCRRPVSISWRTFADGHVECVPCAMKAGKK